MALGGDALVKAVAGDVRVVERVEKHGHQHERRRPACPKPLEVCLKLRLLTILSAPAEAVACCGTTDTATRCVHTGWGQQTSSRSSKHRRGAEIPNHAVLRTGGALCMWGNSVWSRHRVGGPGGHGG